MSRARTIEHGDPSLRGVVDERGARAYSGLALRAPRRRVDRRSSGNLGGVVLDKIGTLGEGRKRKSLEQ